MVDVKIPKIFNIDKSYVIEHLDGFIREIAYNYIAGNLHNELLNEDSIDKLCRHYYWNKFNKTGQVVFTHEEVYKHNMNNGRKRFKDSCYAKKDWIVFIENVDQVIETVMLLSHSLYMQNPVIDDDDVKSECIYSVILEKLMFRGAEKEDQKDKLIGENDQKY